MNESVQWAILISCAFVFIVFLIPKFIFSILDRKKKRYDDFISPPLIKQYKVDKSFRDIIKEAASKKVNTI